MPESAELRRQIDDLALRLVIVEPEAGAKASDWMPALEQILQNAQLDRAHDLAHAAGQLIASLGEADSSGAGFDVLTVQLQEGITRLQEALEIEAHLAVSDDLSPAHDPELLGDFVLESREHLAGIEAQALIIERDPSNAEALNSVFRGFHTIKGLAGFLELWEVQELAHEVETILDRARNSHLTITPVAVDAILQGADYLRRWLSHVEFRLRQQPSEAPEKDEQLLTRIRALSGPAEARRSTGEISTLAFALEPRVREAPCAGNIEGPAPKQFESPEENPDAAKAPLTISPQPVEVTAVQIEAEDRVSANGPVPATQRAESRSVKVDTAKLDYLVDMAGEMVIAETLVRHDPDLATVINPKLQRKIAQLTRITAELQKTAMAMRLVPIGPLFHRMARLVRDLSRQFGKQVELKTEGDEIELDRTIAEELSDPLMHMVRNSLDHGFESPKERVAGGKNATGQLLLKAHHQAGQVVIEIADDGRGLDRNGIKDKAIEKGLVASADGLSDTEIYNFIFLPGFSTAGRVTNVSGRGVGMDVVRRHIEKLRGRIEIRSSQGRGSAFLLKLPLTLAIIDGLVVGVGQERYIVPLFAVREMFRPGQDTIWTVQQNSEMALVRGVLLPVHRLYRKFHVTPKSEDPLQSVLVVAEVEGQRYCLMVDDLIGKQEVVIKTLGETFQNVAGIAGGAILGDGRVGLILDLDRLFKEKSVDSTR